MPNRKTELPPRTQRVPTHLLALMSAVLVAILFLITTVPAMAQGSRTSNTKVDDAQLRKLIRELGSESYAVRQLASEQLWQIGSDAVPALKLASEEGNTEVAKRARQILAVFGLGIDAQTSPEVAQLILRFNNSGKLVRANILRKLVREDRFQLTFDLLKQVDKAQQQQLFKEILSLDDTLIRLARSDRWSEFEFLFSHPITFKHDPTVAVFYHLANNSLDQLLNELQKEILEEEADGKKLTSQELFSLTAILRLTGTYKDAEKFASKHTEPVNKFRSLHLLWMEQGQWDKIAEVMVGKDAAVRPEDGKLVATESQQAVVHHFNANEAGYRNVIEGLNKKRDEFNSNDDEAGANKIRLSLMQIGMATLDWELVESNLDREDESNVFAICQFTRRVEESLESLGLGESVDQRNLWFNRRLRTIKSLKAKIVRLDKKQEDTKESTNKLEETWNLCFEIAEQLQQLGFDSEAALHYGNLFSAMDENEQFGRRAKVLQGLMALERYDDAWKLIERGFTSREHSSLLYTLFPKKYTQARYWHTKLAKQYRDPIKRLAATSGMLNSPMGTLPGFDVEKEIAQLQVDGTSNNSGTVDYQLHLIYLYHGKHELSDRYHQMAGELGYSVVKKNLAQEAFEKEEFEKAIEYYENAWKQRTAPIEAILASKAFEKNGDARKAMLRKCLAYAFWRDSYRNTTTINTLVEMKLIGLIEGFIHIDVCSPYGKVASNERYRSNLATAQAGTNLRDSVNNRMIALFNSCARNPNKFPSTTAHEAIQLNLGMAKLAISEKRFDNSLHNLLRINSFVPGDPLTGENLIAELDKAGASEQADKLFEAITEPYFKMIAKYPDSPSYRNDYAWLCACANRRTEHMLRHIETAVSLRNNHSNYIDTLAEISFLLGKREAAIELTRRCISLDPSKVHYREQLKRFTGKKMIAQ